MGTPLSLSSAHRIFGLKINELRKKRKLTQEELAYIIGVDTTYISQIENGKRNLTIDKIFKLAKAFKIQPRDLF